MKESLAEVVDFKIEGRIIIKIRFVDDTAIMAKTKEELQDMVNRLIDTGRKYGMEINIEKSQVMRVYRSNESLQIKVNNRELKEVDPFKYLGSVLTSDGYCTREIKMRIAIAKEAFNKKRHS
jgi:Reverse transcriptase (RNA-dependent DNA polymerase).